MKEQGRERFCVITTAIPSSNSIDEISFEKHGEDNNSKGDAAKEKMVDFSQEFFSNPAFFTVSGQISAEAYACTISDIYTFRPTFRAGNSTSGHLAEFWMVEPEMAFATLEVGKLR